MGGVKPLLDAAYAGVAPEDVVLAWKMAPHPYLQVLAKGESVVGHAGGTALEHLMPGEKDSF